MKIYSWNVNGIRAASQKGYQDWFESASPEILCLQETKAQPDQLEETMVEPNGYKSYWNSAEKKGYSGVATFSKAQPESVSYGINDALFDNEGRVIESDYGDFVLFNIYFPNGRRDLSRVEYKLTFCERVLDRCNALVAAGKNVVVCGDYNTAHKEIDLTNPKANQKTTGFLPEERAWMDRFIENGYVDTFRHFNDKPDQYTWWSYRFSARQKNIGWRIDYFFVNEKFLPRVKDAFILPEILGSDHCPVGIELHV
ncbi:MAG: exodeoxyribonuclease III [Calditrichales bacterium]|nr:MAG: exodeoxyribonuclease III [Calditrichales bacterium]